MIRERPVVDQAQVEAGRERVGVGLHPALGRHPRVAQRVGRAHVGELEALDEFARVDRLLVDLDPVPDAHHPQLGVALAQPALDLRRFRGHDEQGVRGPDLVVACRPARWRAQRSR